MAKHWHITFPYSIIIEDKPELAAEFEKKFKGDFVFEKALEYQEITPISSGHSLTFKRRDLFYQLAPGLLKEEFLVFYRFLLYEFRKMYGEDSRKMFSHFFETDFLEDFLREMEDLNCQGFELGCVEKIHQLPSNYFLHFDTIQPQNVVEGYPLNLSFQSRMEVVCLIHSYEELNMSPKETIAFHNFTDYIKNKSLERFRLAKYLFTTGY